MATGLEMLMKSFGFDPAEMKGAVDGFRQLMVSLDTRLSGIQEQLSRADVQQRAIMAHLGVSSDATGQDGHSGSVGQPGQPGVETGSDNDGSAAGRNGVGPAR